MYRFDDKRRRRLLEDALVAELLAKSSDEGLAEQAEPPGRVSATTAPALRRGATSPKA